MKPTSYAQCNPQRKNDHRNAFKDFIAAPLADALMAVKKMILIAELLLIHLQRIKVTLSFAILF
jgi:hypothetical protein